MWVHENEESSVLKTDSKSARIGLAEDKNMNRIEMKWNESNGTAEEEEEKEPSKLHISKENPYMQLCIEWYELRLIYSFSSDSILLSKKEKRRSVSFAVAAFEL